MENYIQNGNSVKLLRVELFLICFGKKSFQLLNVSAKLIEAKVL